MTLALYFHSVTVEGKELGGLQPHHFFAWLNFLGLQKNIMIGCKCMINGGAVIANACLPWPDFLALPL